MIIRENDLLNYISCPVKYSISKNGYDLNKKSYNYFLHEMFNFMMGIYSYDNINNLEEKARKKWDNICTQNKDIITPKNVIEGWGKIYKVYEYIIYNKPKIIDLDVPYEININHTLLTGQLNILIDKGQQIEVLIPSFSNKMPESYLMDSDLKNTIDSLVIKTLYNKDSVFTYYNFTYNKCRYALRNEKDYSKLKTIVDNVSFAIENNIIYPNHDYRCNTCLGRSFCSRWNDNEINKKGRQTNDK